MSKKVFSLEEYSNSLYESGYYAGLMMVGVPVFQVLNEFLESKKTPEEMMAALTVITDIVYKKTRGVKEKSEDLKKVLEKYDFTLEGKLFSVLKAEFPAFYVSCLQVRITDVDIPRGIAEAAEANAKQTELNKLSASKVEQARNNLLAAEFDSKAQALLSRPEMIALKKLEVEMTWAKKGISPYGHDNVFGAETTVVKGLK